MSNEHLIARWRLLAAAAALAAAAGCTMGPDYQRPEVPLPEAWRVAPAEAADLANVEWWHAFGDPQLDEHIETALAANKNLLIAAQRVERYASRLQISQADTLPTAGYTAGASRELRSQERPNGLRPGESPYVSNYELGGGIQWELDLWGRVRRANEAARAELLSSQEARRGVMLSVASSVATGYVRLGDLDQRLALAREALKNRQDAFDLAEQRREGGEGTRLAVERARAAVEEAAGAIPGLERDVIEAENALSFLLGRNPGPVPRRPLEALARPQLPQGVPADVLTRRPDVMAAEQDLVAANARIGVAKTGYFPRLSLSALIGLGADDLQWLFAETARTGQLGAALSGPIFDGGRTSATIREAEAGARESALRFQQTVQTALVEVDTALATQDKARVREDTDARVLRARQEVARLARARYEGGQSALPEVLDAELDVIEARARQLGSRRDALLALVGVYKSMGGGWMQERDSRQAAAGQVGAQR